MEELKMSKKGENIYKRKDGRWEARYQKGLTENGKIKYGYCYGKTYHDAKIKVEKLKASLCYNIHSQTVSKKRFSTYCDEWIQLNKTKVKESTLVKYNTIIEKHVKSFFGGYFPHMINSLLVCEFSNFLLYDKNLSPKTVRDILSLLKSILKYISKQGVNLPQIDIVYPKEVRTDMRILTKDEQNILINYLLTDMNNCKLGILLALTTGMRIGEVCALRWSDISLTDMTIRISATMQRLKNLDGTQTNKTKICIYGPKSNTSYRVIPLTEHITELCNKKIRNPNAFVLTGETNNFMEPRTLQNRLKKYTKECGLDGVHFHVLRHTFATRCVEVGFEIKSLSEILGHASPKITLERYVHSSLELKRSNMNKLAAIGF